MKKILFTDAMWANTMSDLKDPALHKHFRLSQCVRDKVGIHFHGTLSGDDITIHMRSESNVSISPIMGICADEFVFVGEHSPLIDTSGPLYPYFMSRVVRHERGNAYSDLLLQDMVNYLYPDRSIQVVNKYTYDPKHLGVFANAGFYYPASLFRRSHAQYFSDMYKPTPEEFLTALMMEGQYARSEEEETAIKEAEILVKRKGH